MKVLTQPELETLQALLHYAETPGDFTDREIADVLTDAQAVLYPEQEEGSH